MLLHLHAERAIAAAPAAVFALALDPQRFAPLFRGCGPVPAIRRIEALDAPAVGARRASRNIAAHSWNAITCGLNERMFSVRS